MIILFACLVGWLDSSTVEKNKAWSLKIALAGVNTGAHNFMRTCNYDGHNPWHTLYNNQQPKPPCYMLPGPKNDFGGYRHFLFVGEYNS